MPLKNAIEIMLEEGYSRYPVYMEDLDNILGLLHFKDVIRIISQDSQAGENPIGVPRTDSQRGLHP